MSPTPPSRSSSAALHGCLLALAIAAASGAGCDDAKGDSSDPAAIDARDDATSSPASASPSGGERPRAEMTRGATPDSGSGISNAQALDAGDAGDAGGFDASTHGDAETRQPPADAGGDGPEPGEGALPGTTAVVFPAPGAGAVCPDPVLRLRFAEPPRLGERGRVALYAVERPEQPVAVLEMNQARATLVAGGRDFVQKRPAYVEDNQVLFDLPGAMLERGQTYAVTVEAGVFEQPELRIPDLESWRFTVAGAPPAPNTLRVAHDGSGDYCTLRGAFDAVPVDHDQPVEISMAAGTYYGVALLEGKHGVTLRGAGRSRTIIAGENNEMLNPGTAGRALLAVDRASDIRFEQLTIHNQTPQGGGQAEALRMQRCERCTIRDVDALSLQDTLLLSGSVYVEDSYIEGNVDYVWGTGTAFFNRCELKTVGRGGYLVQARNGAGEFGYVFVDCTLSHGPGVGTTYLARIEADRFPASQVAFIDCAMDEHIAPAGFQVTGFANPTQLRFWEHGSRDLSGAPLPLDARLSAARQLSAQEAAPLRDPSHVLGFEP